MQGLSEFTQFQIEVACCFIFNCWINLPWLVVEYRDLLSSGRYEASFTVSLEDLDGHSFLVIMNLFYLLSGFKNK